jgi:uncharacterized protein (TIGR03437 family)
VELMLAAPATGPIDAVWYGPAGSRLYARTQSGKVFETSDFESWQPAVGATEPAPLLAAPAARLPEASARAWAIPGNLSQIYALGRNLYRSDDGGLSWANLTAYKSNPVTGGGQRSLAVAPTDPDQIVLGNDFGVWRSMDGGLSWSGLNGGLPNLPVRRILSTPGPTVGARVWAAGYGSLELPHGGSAWMPAVDATTDREADARRQFSGRIGLDLTAVAIAGETVYAGAADGRIWVSSDAGRTFEPSRVETGGAVTRIFADAAEPRVALVALGGRGPHILRTTNSGAFWDDLTSDLPDAPVWAVAADRASGAVYVATDRGVYYARTDLVNPSVPALQWTPISAQIAAAAVDVKLDPGANQLYAAFDGYGVYATLAPHRLSVLRVVNGADFSARAAAPGSLLSVVGGRVESATAGGLKYPVLAASDLDSQVQVPFEATGPSVALALRTGSGAVSVPLPVLPVSPAIFVGRDGAPMVLDSDSELLLDGRNPARSHTRIQIFATGLGRVRPDWPTGLAAPLDGPPQVVAEVRAFLDRTPVQVTRATLAPGYVGFYVVEVQLPAAVNAGQAELYITAGGQESNRVSLLIEP